MSIHSQFFFAWLTSVFHLYDLRVLSFLTEKYSRMFLESVYIILIELDVSGICGITKHSLYESILL